MKLQELGEFELTKLIREIIDDSRHPEQAIWQDLSIGPGDDAAVWQGNNHLQIATTDTMVQDVHFDLDTVTWDELGWKALAVSLSDIAAMGGIPQYALVSLSLPGELESESISKFIKSMTNLASKFETAIVGGNLTSSLRIIITTTLIGYTPDRVLMRSTARDGDCIAITGYAGTSAAGLENILGKIALDSSCQQVLRRAHLQPTPRIKEGRILVGQGVKTAIDISDGLIADLNHICEASGVNALIELEQIPIHPLVKHNFHNCLELALWGGEDYELLFLASEDTINKAKLAMSCPVTVIGKTTKEAQLKRISLRDRNGSFVPYEREGWDHFGKKFSRAKNIRS